MKSAGLSARKTIRLLARQPSRRFSKKIVNLCLLTTLAGGFSTTAATAQDAAHFINGHWYNGSDFAKREFYAVDGRLQESYNGSDAEVVDLAGAYVLPGYGNAHTHGIGNNDFATESNQFLDRGVFYVANPNSFGSRSPAAREKARASHTVDARFSNGGLTSTGGHPVQIFESTTETNLMDGDAYFVIDTLKDLETRWPNILAGNPDFLKIYLERSEHHEARKNDPAYYGKRGLDPILIPAIVDRAHGAGLRVAAHVTSRHDFLVAIKAGVDEIAHLPLESLQMGDTQLAATNGTVLVTTALSHRPSEGVDLDILHKENLAMLRDAGVAMVLGTDSQASVIDELQRLASFQVFETGELLRMLTYDTPRWIFPDRNLGTLSAGAEANFVVLEANPLEDMSALTRIAAVYKGGQALDIQPPPADENRGIGQKLVSVIMSKGVDAAIAEYHRLKAKEPDTWDFSEEQLNALGYAMMKHGKVAEATTIFQLNCDQFPESSNAWDSLGESYMKRGKNPEAIESYQRAVELDPGNKTAAEKLRTLQGQ